MKLMNKPVKGEQHAARCTPKRCTPLIARGTPLD